jgi:DNA polymerase I-like protein with 3'-5' exonuclease and polymerase domains
VPTQFPGLEQLVYWATVRESIRRRREAGEPPPWSADEIFQRPFCNVERENDRVSVWIREHWREPFRDDPDVWFLMAVARLGGNDPRILAEITPPLPWDRERYLAEFAAKGLKVGVRGYRTVIGQSGHATHEDLAHLTFDPLWKDREQIRPHAGDLCRTFFDRLAKSKYRGLGESFLPGQIVADVKFTPPLSTALDWWDFVTPGPGSRKGLNVVCGRDAEAPWSDDRWHATFAQLRSVVGPQIEEMLGRRLSASDLQSCLCELSKFHKAKTTGEMGRRFTPYGETSARPRRPRPAKSAGADSSGHPEITHQRASHAVGPQAITRDRRDSADTGTTTEIPSRPYPRGLFVSLAAPFIIPATAKSDGLRLAFDIETDGLDDATKVHCVVIADLDGDQIDEYGPDQIDAALAHLHRADCLIGHNIAGYDLPLLRRLHSWTPAPKCAVVDTLIAARLILPHLGDIDAEVTARAGASLGKLHGRYSLEAFGIRLGIPKIGTGIEAWSTWTPEIQARCVGDVATTKALWWFLQPDGYSQQALELEHRVAAVCARITADGIPFNRAAAERLRRQWEARRDELETQLRQQFPKTKNFNSRRQIGKLLEARGWVFEKRTKKTGAPKIDDEVLERLPTIFPEFAGLAEYHILSRRLGQLADGPEAWLQNIGDDGRIHGGLIHIGTPHGRAKHLHPNIAQVPNPKRGKPFATECRTLFRADDWVFVTCDQANLQDRAVGHYLQEFDNGAYIKAFVDGVDMHWQSAIALGLIPPGTERDKANAVHIVIREGSKSFRYGFLFGAGAKRAGEIIAEIVRSVARLDPTNELCRRRFDGGEARRRFMAATPGLRQLRRNLDRQHNQHGWVLGLDGRRVPTGAQYKALNRLVTAAEAVLCKRWLVNVADELRERFDYGWGGNAAIVAWIHDELVVCCKPEIAEPIGEIMVRHAKEAGEHYQLGVPLDAEYKIGRSWAGKSAPTSAAVDTIVTDANDGDALDLDRNEVSADDPLAALVHGGDGEPGDEGSQAGLAAAGIGAESTVPPRAEPAAEVTALTAALDYAARGWPVLPVPPGTKKSYKSAEHNGGARWGATLNPDEIRRDWEHWPDAGVGIVAGAASGVWVLEADTLAAHGVDGLASLVALEAKHGKLPDTLMVESPRGSLHRWFKHSGNGVKIKCSASAVAPGVDVIGDGGMIMAPPSVRPGVGVYRWVNDLPIAEAPTWLLGLVKEQPHEQGSAEPEAAIEQIVMALAEIPNSDIGWEAWNYIGMATWRATGGGEAGYEAFAQWSAKSSKHNAEIARERWEHYAKSPPTSVGAGTLFFLAKGEWQRDPRFAKVDPENDAAEEIDPLADFHFDGTVSIEPEPNLIDGLLSTTGLTLIGGQSSAGKSFLAIAMAVCLAEKKPFFGREVRERVGTLYIAGEGQGAIATRFAAAKIASNIELERRLPIAWLDAPPSLESASKIAAFVTKLQALNVKFRQEHDVRLGVVIIDTASACFDLKDENDNAEVTRICKIMQRVGAGFGGVAVPVHHYGKVLEAGPRGASAWRGHTEIILGALADIDPLTGAPTDRALVVAKNRDGIQGPVAPFTLEFIPLGVDKDGREFGACVVKPELEGEVQFGKATKRKAARSETALREAIDAALNENGVNKTFQGRNVRATTADQVRLEFNRRYLVTEEDPLKAARAKRVAFNRALAKLPTEFGMGEFEGMQWIWRS